MTQLVIKPGYNNYFSQVHGSAFAHSIAQLSKNYDGILTVLLPDAASVFSLKKEIEFFLGNTTDVTINNQTEGKSTIPVITLPDWETLPYDYFSPHQDIISERLQTLYLLPRLNRGVLLLPVSSALQKLPTRDYIEQQCLMLKKGQTIEIESLRLKLNASGYTCVTNVMEHGEFAVRGAIIDLFPTGAPSPIRIELFDDEIDSLRYFDSETQLTISKVDEINLLPAREYPTDEAAIARFRQNWRSSFDSNIKEAAIYRDVSKGIFSAGIEYYLPLFFDQLSTIFDFLDKDNILLVHQNQLALPVESFWTDLNERYEQYRYDIERPIVEPSSLFLRADELFGQFKQTPSVIFKQGLVDDQTYTALDYSLCPKVQVEHRANNPVANLKSGIQAHSKTLICAESTGRQEVLRELFNKNKIQLQTINHWDEFEQLETDVALITTSLQQGFVLGIV